MQKPIKPTKEEIISKVNEYSKKDHNLIEKAYDFAQKAHEGQVRESGDPFFKHPAKVALLLTGFELDDASICGGLLHDVIEDTDYTYEDVKNELITSVAHDLRTPLTSIIGYLYLALTKEELEEEKKKRYIEIAYDKSKRLEKLLEDLFRYTKYSTDEVRIQNQPIDFVKFMEQMMEEFYPNFQDAGLMYEFHTEIDKAYIMADGELLARAVGNLVSNAIKYGKDGKIIKVYIKQCANYVSLSILNYGPLIPQENLAHIFERFYRVENSRSEQTGGSGLGLAIAKQIVTLHNGEIDVKSDYDGTVFEVRLKLSQNSGENSYEDKK